MEMGKIRTVPHTSGQWACHLYLTSQFSETAIQQFELLTEKLKEVIPTIQREEWPHISLSKTFYAKHWHLDLLQKKFASSLKDVRIENLQLDKFAVYQNEEATRSFLALDCANDKQVISAVNLVDDVLQGFGYETYYEAY
jgi:hypothetical protein